MTPLPPLSLSLSLSLSLALTFFLSLHACIVSQELMKHMPVHSYGKCLHNKDEPPRGKLSQNENKRKVLSQYKWYLAFENNIIKVRCPLSVIHYPLSVIRYRLTSVCVDGALCL